MDIVEKEGNNAFVGENILERIRSSMPANNGQDRTKEHFFNDPKYPKKINEAFLKLETKGKFDCLGIREEDAKMISSFVCIEKLIDEVNCKIRSNWDSLQRMNDSTDEKESGSKAILKSPLEYLEALLSAFTRYPRFASSKLIYTARALEEGEDFKRGDTFVWKEFVFASASQPSVGFKKGSTKSLIFEVHGDFLAYDVGVINDPKRLTIKDSKIAFKDSTVVLFPGAGCTVKDVRTDENNENVLRVYVECRYDPRIYPHAEEPNTDNRQMRILNGAFDSFNSLPVDFFIPLRDAISFAFRKEPVIQDQLFGKLTERNPKEEEESLLRTLGMSKENFLALYLLGVEVEFPPPDESEKGTTVRLIDHINYILTKDKKNVGPFRELILHILCSMRRIPRYLASEDRRIYMLMTKSEFEEGNVLPGITLAYDREMLRKKLEKLEKSGDAEHNPSALVVCEIAKGYEHLQAHSAVPFINCYSRISSKGIQDESK